MQAVKETLSTLARNRYVLCALVFVGTVGPGIVRLAKMLEEVRR